MVIGLTFYLKIPLFAPENEKKILVDRYESQ